MVDENDTTSGEGSGMENTKPATLEVIKKSEAWKLGACYGSSLAGLTICGRAVMISTRISDTGEVLAILVHLDYTHAAPEMGAVVCPTEAVFLDEVLGRLNREGVVTVGEIEADALCRAFWEAIVFESREAELEVDEETATLIDLIPRPTPDDGPDESDDDGDDEGDEDEDDGGGFLGFMHPNFLELAEASREQGLTDEEEPAITTVVQFASEDHDGILTAVVENSDDFKSDEVSESARSFYWYGPEGKEAYEEAPDEPVARLTFENGKLTLEAVTPGDVALLTETLEQASKEPLVLELISWDIAGDEDEEGQDLEEE